MIKVTDDDHAAMALIREIFETAPAEQTIADTVAQAFATHRTQAAKAERDRIVAWLRKEAGYSQAVADDESNFLDIRASAERAALVKSRLADALEEQQP